MEPMRRLQSLEQCFLDQVLRVGLIAAKQKGGTQEAITTSPDEFLHSRGLAPFEPGDQFLFVHCNLVPVKQKGFNSIWRYAH